jgi:hypothetical protein
MNRPRRRRRGAKLNLAKAAEIRRQWFVLKRKQTEIAADFNIKQPLVSKICCGYAWNSKLAPPPVDRRAKEVKQA